jgi:hypothetical protein
MRIYTETFPETILFSGSSFFPSISATCISPRINGYDLEQVRFKYEESNLVFSILFDDIISTLTFPLAPINYLKQLGRVRELDNLFFFFIEKGIYSKVAVQNLITCFNRFPDLFFIEEEEEKRAYENFIPSPYILRTNEQEGEGYYLVIPNGNGDESEKGLQLSLDVHPALFSSILNLIPS